MQINITNATTKPEGEAIPKKRKSKGIKGRSNNYDITKRYNIINKIMEDKDLETYTRRDFMLEFRKACNEHKLEVPSDTIINKNLLACGYKLRTGRFLRVSEYNPMTQELLNSLFTTSGIKRLTVQVKGDEFIFIPIIGPLPSDDNDTIDLTPYFESLYDSLEENYTYLCTTSIQLYFTKTGYESSILALIYNSVAPSILSFSEHTYGITITCTVGNARKILSFIYDCLPNVINEVEDELGEYNLTQPF